MAPSAVAALSDLHLNPRLSKKPPEEDPESWPVSACRSVFSTESRHCVARQFGLSVSQSHDIGEGETSHETKNPGHHRHPKNRKCPTEEASRPGDQDERPTPEPQESRPNPGSDVDPESEHMECADEELWCHSRKVWNLTDDESSDLKIGDREFPRLTLNSRSRRFGAEP